MLMWILALLVIVASAYGGYKAEIAGLFYPYTYWGLGAITGIITMLLLCL